MKSSNDISEMRAEYDFSKGVRNKFAALYLKGHSVTVHKKDGSFVTTQFPATSQGGLSGNLEFDSGDSSMHIYLLPLISAFEQNANPAQAAPMKKYMRDQFEYLGIKTPERRELQKQFYEEHGLPFVVELKPILLDLWDMPQREYQYTAIGLLGRLAEAIPHEFITTIEYLIVTKSWWDTVDSLAGEIVGIHFHRFPKVREKYLAKWRKSDNFWLRRTCILFQLGYKEETDFNLLCEIIRENLGSQEFFINKAIGWALRQYARTDPKSVKKFVQATELHSLSRREAMKHLE